MKQFIKELSSLFGPSGSEDQVREYCMSKSDWFESKIDGLGNLILHKKGNGPKLAFVCGMDEKGLFISHEEEDGKLRFCCLGDSKATDLKGRNVLFSNNSEGVIETDQEEPELKQLWITITKGTAPVGTVGMVLGEWKETTNTVTSCSVGRSACVAVLLELMKQEFGDKDVWFVFSSLYQLGKKGALVALSQIKPTLAFMIEPVSTEMRQESTPVALGEGVVLKLRDGAFMDYLHLSNRLEDCDVPYQLYVSSKPEIPGRSPMMFGIPSVVLGIPYEAEGYFTQSIQLSDVKHTLDFMIWLAGRESFEF